MSTTTLTNFINFQPDYWLENFKALQQAFVDPTTTNNTLREKINALEGVDKELAIARDSVTAIHDALNQALGGQTVYKNQVAELTRQLAQSNLNLAAASVAPVLQARPSLNHSDPDKFNGDKTKLEAFVTQLRIKLQQNTNHFVRPGQNTEQNQLSYAISHLESDAFLQIEPYVSQNGIDLPDVPALEDLLETRFGDVDPVGTAKHKLYRLYQANKNLKMFLNTFLVLAKKAKLDNSQTLDLLYEKLSDEFKNLLVTKKKQTNLVDLIKKLCNMDSSIKIINQQKRSTSNTVNTATKSSAYQQTTRFVRQPTRFAPVAPAAITTTTSTATGTYAGPMDVSSVRRGLLSAEEKERWNKLGLCRYCGQPSHIARDHKDSNTLLAKRHAAGIHEMTIAPSNTMTLSSNATAPSNTIAMLENTPSSSTVALGDLLD